MSKNKGKDKSVDKNTTSTSKPSGRSSGKNGRQNNNNFNKSSGSGKLNDSQTYGVKTDSSNSRGGNDPSWYTNETQLISDAARVSFVNSLGHSVSGLLDSYSGNYTVPGVTAIYYTNVIAEATKRNSASDINAKRFANALRSTVSMNLTFSAPDAMFYLLALDGLGTFYSHCVRIYAMHNSYVGLNRYYPETFYKALGIAVNSKTDWNAFRIWLNKWVSKLSQLYGPQDIALFKRHLWLPANVFMDAPDPKAQSYIFVPRHIYTWDDGTVETNGTRLLLKAIPGTENAGLKTLEDLQTFGDEVLENFVSSTDVNSISAMCARLYGLNNKITFDMIPEGLTLDPVYNPEVLNQIHNITISGVLDAANSGTVTQTTGDLISVEYKTYCGTESTLVHMDKDLLIDLPMVQPNETDVMVATRLMSRGVVDPADNTKCTLTVYGTEVVEFVKVYNMADSLTFSSSCVCNTANEQIKYLARTTAFDSFPILFAARHKVAPETRDVVEEICANISNFTTISSGLLDKIHDAAALSLFKIPVEKR